MNDDDDILAAIDDFGKSGKSSWVPKKLFRRDKPSVKLTFKQKKRNYKLAPVPRTRIYEPIRNNTYYSELKNRGADKDDILCGVNKDTIEINKALFDSFTAADLKSNERQMFLWVLLNTTGYKKREVMLDVKRIAGEIGRSRSFVYTALNRLVEKKMIFITQKDGNLSIYLNTMTNTWISVGNRVHEILNKYEFGEIFDEDL